MPPLELVLQQGFNGLMLGMMYALIAVGFTLFFGVLDVIHFSHGDIFMIGAFAGLSLLLGLGAAGLHAAPVVLPLALAGSILITGAIRAVAQDPEAAQMMGVNLDRTVDATFFLGSGLAAVAGILSGLYYSEIHFIMGITGGVIGFSAAAIGGLGNVYGAIVGGLLFGVLQTTAAALIPRGSEFRDVVAFAVVMLFLIFKPSGILGEKSVERV